jgi:hypothetical protein
MACPIKETPVLYGEDARRFEERMKHPKPVSQEKIERMNKAYEIFKKNVIYLPLP